MKKFAAFTLALSAAAACAPADPIETADRAAMAESQLAEALRDRVAGPPISCVNRRLLRGNRSAGEGAIIFGDVGDRVLYVNNPPAGCPELNSGRALQTQSPSTQLCRGDIVSVFDPLTGFSHGSCGLGDFTPYRRG